MGTMKIIARIVIVFSVLLVATAMSSTAYAQAPAGQAAKDEAQDRYKRGIELYEEENFTAALTEFKRAYELIPAYQVLYNVARTCYQLRDYVCSLRTFERYIADGGAAIDAKRKDEVEREMVSIRRRVATVTLRATPGATISVDGVAIGDAPLPAALQVNEGRRLVRATMAGHDSVEKVLDYVGGTTTALDLTFSASSVATGPQRDYGPSTGKSSSNTKWYLWGGTAVLAVATGVTGGLALGASGDAKDIRSNGGTLSDYDSAESKMRTLSVVTDILGIATIGMGVAALFVTLSSGSDSKTASGKIPPSVRGFTF
jgi:hypothetical protein